MSEPKRQERWNRTRQQILDGAVASLVRHGYAGTTMQRVQEESGVTRGALTHHFGSMRELVIAAYEHVIETEVGYVESGAADQPAQRAVGLLHEAMRRPTYLAGLELWVAARTDSQLRKAIGPGSRRTGSALRELFRDKLDQLSDDDLALFVDGLQSLMRGLAVGGVLRDRPDREQRVLTAWIDAFLPQES